MALSEKQVTLDLRVMSSGPTMDVEPTLKNKIKRNSKSQTPKLTFNRRMPTGHLSSGGFLSTAPMFSTDSVMPLQHKPSQNSLSVK